MIADATRNALAQLAHFEASVLGYHHDASSEEFSLVVVSHDHVAPATIAVASFRFVGVRSFRREKGTATIYHDVEDTFVRKDHGGTPGVQRVTVHARDGSHFVELGMGDFGGVRFACAAVSHEVIELRSATVGDAREFFEVPNGRPVNFYNPFEYPWANGHLAAVVHEPDES